MAPPKTHSAPAEQKADDGDGGVLLPFSGERVAFISWWWWNPDGAYEGVLHAGSGMRARLNVIILSLPI